MLHFGIIWHALGPFSIGTREDPWYDSIDIGSIDVSEDVYPSTLCRGATWKAIEMDLESMDEVSTSISLNLTYPEIDWHSLVQVYGWAVTQFDAWVRGYLYVDEDCHVRLNVRNSPEFILDGDRYEGDIYDLGTSVTLKLSKGRHRLDARVVNEIRIFGFKVDPTATLMVDVSRIQPNRPLEAKFHTLPDSVRVGEEVKSASTFVSLHLDCVSNDPIAITSVDCQNMKATYGPRHLASFQSVRLLVELQDASSIVSEVRLCYTVAEAKHHLTIKTEGAPVIDFSDPHLITYKNSNQTIGRAIVRPPREVSSDTSPILLALHGANVDIASPTWKDIFKNSYPDAWIVQPDCGKWGDDWHELSWRSIGDCLSSLGAWASRHAWKGAHADTSKIFIMGHSNGSQGAMQFMMRNAHRIIGSALVSGYTSISRYVPYTMWRTNALETAERPQYDITRNMDNVKGIKCFIRHGVEDDNVPIYHSRLLASLDPSFVFEEVPGQGHWFDGILTEGGLKVFVEDCLRRREVPRYHKPEVSVPLPTTRSSISSTLEKSQASDDGVRTGPSESVAHAGATLSRDASCIFDSQRAILIEAPTKFAHRIAHSLLLYYGINSVIADGEEQYGNIIRCTIDDTMSATQMRLRILSNVDRLTLHLTAADDEDMSKLIRLVPWRTGVGVPGDLLIDTSRGTNMVVHARMVEVHEYGARRT